MQLTFVSFSVLIFASVISLVDAQADFLEVATSPAFIFRAALIFLQGRCWNFYSQDFRYPGMPNRDDYTDIFFTPSVAYDFITLKVDGPPQMQGLFHLQIPDMVPEIVSFYDSDEGGGLGQPLQGNPPSRLQRLMSQANWGVPNSAGNLDLLTGERDVILNWVVQEGTAENPLSFDVIIDVKLPVACFRTSTENCGAPFPVWTLALQNDPNVNPHADYPESYVWLRTSVFEGESSTYEAVQVVDGSGNLLLNAWDNWVSVTNGRTFITKVVNTPAADPVCNSRPFWCIVPIPLLCG